MPSHSENINKLFNFPLDKVDKSLYFIDIQNQENNDQQNQQDLEDHDHQNQSECLNE